MRIAHYLVLGSRLLMSRGDLRWPRTEQWYELGIHEWPALLACVFTVGQWRPRLSLGLGPWLARPLLVGGRQLAQPHLFFVTSGARLRPSPSGPTSTQNYWVKRAPLSPAQPSLSKQWTGRANQPPAYLDMNRLQNAQDFRKVTDHFPGNYGIRFYLIKRKKNRKITTSYNQHSWTWKHYDFAWLCSRVSTGPKRKNYRIWSYLSFIQHKFLTASSPPAL